MNHQQRAIDWMLRAGKQAEEFYDNRVRKKIFQERQENYYLAIRYVGIWLLIGVSVFYNYNGIRLLFEEGFLGMCYTLLCVLFLEMARYKFGDDAWDYWLRGEKENGVKSFVFWGIMVGISVGLNAWAVETHSTQEKAQHFTQITAKTNTLVHNIDSLRLALEKQLPVFVPPHELAEIEAKHKAEIEAFKADKSNFGSGIWSSTMMPNASKMYSEMLKNQRTDIEQFRISNEKAKEKHDAMLSERRKEHNSIIAQREKENQEAAAKHLNSLNSMSDVRTNISLFTARFIDVFVLLALGFCVYYEYKVGYDAAEVHKTIPKTPGRIPVKAGHEHLVFQSVPDALKSTEEQQMHMAEMETLAYIMNEQQLQQRKSNEGIAKIMLSVPIRNVGECQHCGLNLTHMNPTPTYCDDKCKDAHTAALKRSQDFNDKQKARIEAFKNASNP